MGYDYYILNDDMSREYESSFYGDVIVNEYDEQNNLMNPPSPVGFLFYMILGYGFDKIAEWCTQFMNDMDILTANTKGLDKFWGVSYNMPRPSIIHNEYLLIDAPERQLVEEDNTWIARGLNDFRIEFDTIPGKGKAGRIILRNERGGKQSLLFSTNTHVTLEKVGNMVEIYQRNPQKSLKTGVTGSSFNVAFSLFTSGGSYEYYYENLKVYTLNNENPTPLTDDEYKIYLYLRNCRLLTMEDIEINMNKCFSIDDNNVYFSEEMYGLEASDHLAYESEETISSNLHKNTEDDSAHFVTDFDDDEETMRILSGLITNEENVLVINIPSQGWDKNFLEFMEQYISLKGNLKIKEYTI